MSCALFGLYGLENEKRLRSDDPALDQVGQRQQHWLRLALEQRNPVRTQVAERGNALWTDAARDSIQTQLRVQAILGQDTGITPNSPLKYSRWPSASPAAAAARCSGADLTRVVW